jgi:hypothetical protein
MMNIWNRSPAFVTLDKKEKDNAGTREDERVSRSFRHKPAKDPRKYGPRHVAASNGKYTHDVGNKDAHNAKTAWAISYCHP